MSAAAHFSQLAAATYSSLVVPMAPRAHMVEPTARSMALAIVPGVAGTPPPPLVHVLASPAGVPMSSSVRQPCLPSRIQATVVLVMVGGQTARATLYAPSVRKVVANSVVSTVPKSADSIEANCCRNAAS